MNATAIFVKNVEMLMKSRGGERPFAFWNKVNEIAGKRVITPSYWSKIKSSLREGGVPHNVSLGVVEETAKTMDLEAWQLIHPNFSSNRDETPAASVNREIEKSILFAKKVASQRREPLTPNAIGEIAITHYSQRNGTSESLALAVLDVMNKISKP